MIEALLEHNKAWAAERVRNDPDYFKRLSGLQAPQYLWIGCSDSRVPANVITGLEPGEVFVHRNVANLLHPGDLNGLSVLQFAVEVLKVSYIIVCGHYGCGGVAAAVDGQRHGLIDHWLRPIQDVYERFEPDLAALPDAQARLARLCELNVEQTVGRVAQTPVVQDAWRSGRSLAIHGWVYGLDDGVIRDLGCTVSGDSGRPAGPTPA
ncbi:carbonic anhydrase [Thalassobaculum sp.]|uniref:carbonic anhydrase n=1 Tax=Thalassobaculum sp. TaxID=2022740 RepID=UPI0032EE4E63